MIKSHTLYLAIKRPQDKDYYLIASHHRPATDRPFTRIDDLSVLKKAVIGFRHFTAEESSLKLCLDKVTEELSTENVPKEHVTLEGLLIFDFDLETERASKAEAYVFNSINVEIKENEILFDSEDSYLRVEVGIDGERVELIGEPVKSSNFYNLGVNVKL